MSDRGLSDARDGEIDKSEVSRLGFVDLAVQLQSVREPDAVDL